MDIDKECAEALARVNHKISEHARTTKRSVSKMMLKPVFPPAQTFVLVIRDIDHFYKIIHWCNRNIGKGVHNWTCKQRVKTYLDPTSANYNPPAIKDWIVYKQFIDISPLYLL